MSMSREEWLCHRATGIGGTDIAAIAGVHPYASPASVWADKMGLSERIENSPMRWGKRLERSIADEYGERERKHIVFLADQIVDKTLDGVHLLGSPDAMVFPDGQPPEAYDILTITREAERGLEIKTASSWAKGWGQGAAEIPGHYFVQCQWYMMLTGQQFWDLAVLIGGMDYRVYRLEAHKSLQEALIEKGVEFWHQYVETKTPPPADASSGFRNAMDKLIPKKAEPILGDEEMDDIAEEIRQAREAAKAAEARVKLAENRMLETLTKKGANKVMADNWRVNHVEMPGQKSVDYKQLIRDLNITQETLAKYEKQGNSYKVFRFEWKGEDDK